MTNPLPIDIESLPSVLFSERTHLPHISAVYFAMGEDETVLYIGKTINLRNRWMSHHHITDLIDLGCIRIAWHASEQDNLTELEEKLIRLFTPPLNRPLAPANVQQISFRLPHDLYQIIQEMADAETRPINSQAIVLLREAIAARQASKDN